MQQQAHGLRSDGSAASADARAGGVREGCVAGRTAAGGCRRGEATAGAAARHPCKEDAGGQPRWPACQAEADRRLTAGSRLTSQNRSFLAAPTRCPGPETHCPLTHRSCSSILRGRRRAGQQQAQRRQGCQAQWLTAPHGSTGPRAVRRSATLCRGPQQAVCTGLLDSQTGPGQAPSMQRGMGCSTPAPHPHSSLSPQPGQYHPSPSPSKARASAEHCTNKWTSRGRAAPHHRMGFSISAPIPALK